MDFRSRCGLQVRVQAAHRREDRGAPGGAAVRGLRQRHAGDRDLQPGAAVAATQHLLDQLDVALGVAAVAAAQALGPREAVPGLPHPQRRGRHAGALGRGRRWSGGLDRWGGGLRGGGFGVTMAG